MSQQRFIILYHKYVSETLTLDEWREWKQLFSNEAYAALFSSLVAETTALDFPVTEQDRGDSQSMFRAIVGEAPSAKPVSIVKVKRLNTVWLRYAAILIVALSAAWYIWDYRSASTIAIPEIRAIATKSGTTNEKPILILANGTIINLDSAGSGMLASESGSMIIKTGEGMISYSGASPSLEAIATNTVQTPKGRQYQILLPDGSKVWLNAYTSISFPAVFPRDKRQVEVSGEAYFEIATDKIRPFKVEMGSGKSVEVLGTSFNVNNYADEPMSTATLFEGSVKVNSPQNEIILKRSETVNISQKCVVDPSIDPDQQIAWKKGIFSFHGTDTRALLRQISRWYGVDIVYQNNIQLKFFQGKIGRDLSLAQIQKVLRDFGIENELKGNQLIIK